jgi:cobalamin biosynthesis Mg chelatase CobN
MTFAERDRRVMQLSEQLREIEQRLIPTGLHVFGRAAELKEKTDLLRMVASFDRPEQGVCGLPRLVAQGLQITGYEELQQEGGTSETKQLIDEIVAESVSRFCESGSDSAVDHLTSRANVDREAALGTLLRKFTGGPGSYEGLFELLTGVYRALGRGSEPPR